MSTQDQLRSEQKNLTDQLDALYEAKPQELVDLGISTDVETAHTQLWHSRANLQEKLDQVKQQIEGVSHA